MLASINGDSLFKALVLLKAATRGILWNKVFLEISQNSQENACAKVPFLTKLQMPATLLKKRI